MRSLAALLVLLFLWVTPAGAQSLPPQDPILRVNPGMHTGAIWRVGADSTCSVMATASADETVRLWQLPEGKPLRVLRPPTGLGNDGQIRAAAVGPSGAWVAAAGWDEASKKSQGGYFVFIFQSLTGAVLARLGPLDDRIYHLAVSPEGQHIAATLYGGAGLRVWERTGPDAGGWRLVAEDRDYGGQASNGAAFDRTGALYTVADDGKLRRYAPGYKARPASVSTRGGSRPYSVAVHPSGDRIAVGFDDAAAVDVYDAATLAWRFAADTGVATNGSLNAVAWSTDGQRLYAGGRFKHAMHPILIWDREGQGSPRDPYYVSHNNILHMLPCGEGLLVGAADPAFGFLAADGSYQFWKGNVQADLRSQRGVTSIAAAADGRRIRFEIEDRNYVLFDLAMVHGDPPGSEADLRTADTTSLPVTDWINNKSPKLAGAPIALERFEEARALAIAPNRRRFVLGTDWLLRAFDGNGTQLWQQKTPDVAWSLNIPADSNVIVAGYADGTIRWHRMTDGRELLALFVRKGNERWVAWTPKGYFAASAGGDNLVGWHVNRSWDKAADFFAVSKFRDHFYRPDIVARVLGDLDEDTAIAEANKTAGRTLEHKEIRKRQPPVLRILSPADGFEPGSDEVKIEYGVRTPSGLPIKRVFAQVDGGLVHGKVTTALEASGDTKGTLTVKLPPRDVIVSVTAETEFAFDTQNIRLVRTKKLSLQPAQDAEQPKSTLFALLIGVANYANMPTLAFADDDALALANLLAGQKGLAYADVKIKLLTTRKDRGGVHDEAEASHGNIIKGLNWLRKSRADSEGTILVYFSGHGQTLVDGSSYLLPADFDRKDYFGTALSKAHILDGLTRQGRALIFIDACHAAGGLSDIQARPLHATGFVNDATASGSWVYAFASSLPTQPSFGTLEGKSFFTRMLVDGLRGDAAARGEKVITTGDLDTWLDRWVPRQSLGLQNAVMFKSPSAAHVPVARLP